MNSSSDVLKKILSVLEKSSDLKPRKPIQKLNLNSSFRSDLSFDSIAMISFLYELQEEWFFLEEENILEWKTLGDIVCSIKIGLEKQNMEL